MAARTNFTTAEVRRVGEQIGIDWASALSMLSISGDASRSGAGGRQRSSLPGVVGQQGDLEAVVELELLEHP